MTKSADVSHPTSAPFRSLPRIDYSALPKSSTERLESLPLELQLLRDETFCAHVRDWLKTEEQRNFFDFILQMPMAFAMEHAGERWTEERIADHLKIGQDRIPALKKALRRAFKRQLRLLHVER